MLSAKKLIPMHLFLLPSHIKRGYYQLTAEYIICATCTNYTSRVVFLDTNALHAKCKLCYKSRALVNWELVLSDIQGNIVFSNNMLEICVCLWVLTSTGWVCNSWHSCGIAALGIKQHNSAPLVLTKVLNGFGWQKFGRLTDKTTTDDVPTMDGWWMVGWQTDNHNLTSHKGYQLIVT